MTKTSLSLVEKAAPHKAGHIHIPMSIIGPASVWFGDAEAPENIRIPMATFETPLWPSCGRGAKVSREIGGVHAVLLDDGMVRSIAVKAASARKAQELVQQWQEDARLRKTTESTGRYITLSGWTPRIIGRTVYLRMTFETGEAAGHNTVTKAADAVLEYLCSAYPVEYVSVSGNMCVDKKVSAVNSVMGRGKSVIIEGVIPADICAERLKTTPQALHDLNVDKNYVGSLAAGSLCSANAHYANMLLGVYLATGQDAANIVEGSQGMTTTEVIRDGQNGDSLYFAVNLPNIIVGVIGNGKDADDILANLDILGCAPDSVMPAHHSKSQRLAMATAVAVWCGELSLMAAQTNKGELMSTHVSMERTSRE